MTKEKSIKEKAYSNISIQSFLTVAIILLALLFFCGCLSTKTNNRKANNSLFQYY